MYILYIHLGTVYMYIESEALGSIPGGRWSFTVSLRMFLSLFIM